MLESSRPQQWIELDVSELEPPEPLLEIFKALIQLPTHHRLQVTHRRQPWPLYDMLEQTGYHYLCEAGEAPFIIDIWPGDQAQPQALAKLVAQPPACGDSH